MIGIRGRCPTEPSSSSGLHPSPSNARARRGCTCRLRAQNGMPMSAEPKILGGPAIYAMGVFNPSFAVVASLEGHRRSRYRDKPRARS